MKPGPYRAPRWLISGHAQTILPALLKPPAVPLRRQRIETPDGDFIDVDWLDAAAAADAPLVVLFHGLEGSSGSHYARALMQALAATGWRGAVPHFRGCSGEANRLPRAYHSGDHEEIGWMLRALTADRKTGPVFAAGVSLGGSALLNWLGRHGEGAGEQVRAAAAVSAPLDLTAAGFAIGKGLNRIYTRHFLNTLIPKARAMARTHSGSLDEGRIRSVRSMYDFDDAVTAPLHGFEGADDYWSRASSKPWLAGIRVPTLVLNALNDPFVPAASLPRSEDTGPCVILETPEHGGHAGFAGRAALGTAGEAAWLPARLIAFFDEHLNTSAPPL